MTFAGRNRALGIALALVIFSLDQWVKHLVVVTLGLTAEGDQLRILPFFNLTRANNFGVSLGMLTAGSPAMYWFLICLTGAIAAFVTVWMLREKAMIDIAALAMILGGALGNIRDRYDLGYVVDYADLHFGTFRPFLIFNLADACITVGVLIILARSLLSRDKPDAQAEILPEN